jgi:hypothetical protein
MPHTKWSRAILIGVGAAALVTLILIAFIWPTLTSSVRNVPLAVVGNSAQVTQLKTALDSKVSGGFDVTQVATRADAVHLLNTRDDAGAIILTGAPEVLTASAGGTAVSQVLAGIATSVHAKVTDVVPLASADSRGVGLTVASFPLVLGGMLGGILISLVVTGVWRRLASVAIYSILAGAAVVAVMQAWFGVLQGDAFVNGAAMSLAMAATASFIVGANALIGTAGIPLGSVITMLIGNPLSSASAPVFFMPEPWGAVGQWFVPGASATLVRNLSYFPDANILFPWLVLAGWTLLGAIGMVAGHFRNQEVVRIPELEEEPVPAHHPSHLATA